MLKSAFCTRLRHKPFNFATILTAMFLRLKCLVKFVFHQPLHKVTPKELVGYFIICRHQPPFYLLKKTVSFCTDLSLGNFNHSQIIVKWGTTIIPFTRPLPRGRRTRDARHRSAPRRSPFSAFRSAPGSMSQRPISL